MPKPIIEKIKPNQLTKKTKSDTIRQLIDGGCKSVSALSKATGTSHGLASRILKQYKIDKNQLDEYKINRADIYAGLQHRLLRSVSDSDIKKAPLGSKILAACQIFDKERLERGKTTGNIGVGLGISEALQAAVDRISNRVRPVDKPVDKPVKI